MVSPDHRPPTSPARTTNVALPRRPTSSGKVPFFPATSSDKAHPIFVWSSSHGLTIGVQNPNQCGVHSKLLSPVQGWTIHDDFEPPGISHPCPNPEACMMLVRTRPLYKCEPPRFQQRNPSAPTPLPLHKLHGGGQRRRGDGHTGSCAQTKGEVGEGASRARHRKGETQSESSDTKVLLPKLCNGSTL